ncbi:MAG: hypothetical protein MUF31_08570 [Akkermansiaceae bacterium]|jgi:hypothetical protein|nr:hypothetical protein [Akkermansiaceae bacterium]
METQVRPSPEDQLATIAEVLAALRKEGLEVRHEAKNWGDWIHIVGSDTVISIDSNRGLTGSATIEHSEDENDDAIPCIHRAFAALGWVGIDDDGEFSLV